MKKSLIAVIVVLIIVIIIVILSLGVLVFNRGQNMAMQSMSIKSGMAFDSAAMSTSNNYIGYSVGGAKDVENFRENIKNDYFPISTDITYNGLFYDYMFDTGVDDSKRTGKEGLFFPTYSTARSKDPFSGKEETYMTVGLNSNIKEEDFSRKKLNLLVLLDISGSMSSPFYSYYYDNPLEYNNNGEEYSNESKMKLADKAVCTLIDQLKQDDKFGLVTFESNAKTEQKIEEVSKLDLDSLKNKILKITDKGGTNFSAGYIQATSEFEKFQNASKDEYENRIIILTDAMPNTGDYGSSLMGLVKNNATSGIYTTFIGIGVDFNTKLIEEITDVKGANYYSVHNNKEFTKRMGEEFEYMVTPLVFDLSLDVQSNDYNVTAIYGSDSANVKTGNIMKVNTLFPSKSEDGEVKGGIILLKVTPKDNASDGKVKVKVSYKDRNGKEYSDTQEVSFKDDSEEYYDNSGIRKAIVLTRYANTLKDWILYERSEDKKFLIVPTIGIIDGYEFDEDYVIIVLGEHERASVDLSVSDEYKEIFKSLKSYIEEENKVLNDDTFKQEFDALDLLINHD